MGEVWLARQDGLERHVAVKISWAADHQQIGRLRREAQALARIQHPHVVPVHEVGEQDGLHYYVMDLIDGRSLEKGLAIGRLSCARAAEIARQLAEALAAAHDRGVIHREVKPANVLLDGRDHVTLVDFGIALSELAPTLTRTGDLLGTVHYMAPEQARGEAYLADARTDVWGVGVTLYEMISGARPFEGESAVAVRSAVLDRDPVAPRHHRADCPRDLETIVLRCLDKDPERRYPSARALADDLARFLADEPIRARPASLGYRFGKHVRRHRAPWLAGAVTALLGVLGLVGSVLAARSSQCDCEAGEAAELVRVARVLTERGDLDEAWSKLHDVELRFPRTPAVIGAYWTIELARDDGLWTIAAGVAGLGGGGVRQLHSFIFSPPDRRAPARESAPPGLGWSVVPECVRLTLSYVEHVGQWQIALHDLDGKLLHRVIVRSASRPVAGRYLMRSIGWRPSASERTSPRGSGSTGITAASGRQGCSGSRCSTSRSRPRWLEHAARHGGNLDIPRHDRALRDLLGGRLLQLLGDDRGE